MLEFENIKNNIIPNYKKELNNLKNTFKLAKNLEEKLIKRKIKEIQKIKEEENKEKSIYYIIQNSYLIILKKEKFIVG